MNVEEARRIAKERIEQLAAELERGQSETFKTYLAAMAKLPSYSARNLLLILAQRPGARHCAGLRTWNRLGRYVRNGEHGIVILAPCIKRPKSGRATTKQPPAFQPDQTDEEVDEAVVGFRGTYVFDVSQTDGAPLPEPACVDGTPGIYFERLLLAIAARGIQLTYSSAIGAAHGLSTRNHIVLRPDLAPAECFATAAHELGHVLLEHHQARGPPATATLHETEAEAVAYVVCQAIGLQTNSSSSDYVLAWGGSPETLAASLERIQRVAAELITAIGPDV